MSRKALITGITGQDGAYLTRLLIDKGYHVAGGVRRSSSVDLWRLRALGVEEEEIEIVPLELLEAGNITRAIERVQPDEIYNLAAQTFVGVSFEQPLYTMDANALGPVRLLEAARQVNNGIRFYQASTSEMFGKVQGSPQNEQTPFYPRSPYGIAKLAAHWAAINYREAYGMFTCCGILFNHESPLRGPEFVTQKIARGLARIAKGQPIRLTLGNLDAKRDWGFAGDYVQGMWAMMQHDKPGDYVLATGICCTVRSFCNLVAHGLGMDLDWVGPDTAYFEGVPVIVVDASLYRPAEVQLLCGDATLARDALEWQPKTTLSELAKMMGNAALKESRIDG